MNPFKAFDKSNLFVFKKEDYNLAIAGYPDWRGFVAADNTDLWVEVIPSINVLKQKNIAAKDVPTDNEKKKDEFDSDMLRRYFETIPAEIIEPISSFPDSHWGLINAIKLIGNDFLSLIKTNPALVYIIVNMEKINPSFLYYTNIEIFQRMICTKRKEILHLCGFPDTTRIVKIFSKIDKKHLDIKLLVQFKSVLINHRESAERIMDKIKSQKEKIINLY